MGNENERLGLFTDIQKVFAKDIHFGFSLCRESWEYRPYTEHYIILYLFRLDITVGIRLPKNRK